MTKSNETVLDKVEKIFSDLFALQNEYHQSNLMGDHEDLWYVRERLREHKKLGLELGSVVTLNEDAFLKFSAGENKDKITHKQFNIFHVKSPDNDNNWTVILNQENQDGNVYGIRLHDKLENILSYFGQISPVYQINI